MTATARNRPANVAEAKRSKAKPSLPEKGKQELSCDVLVVGAGFAGPVTALRALEQRARVIVIDKQPRGWWTPGGNMIISGGKIPFVPGIVATYGGFLVNAKAQVLDWDKQPIPGLYAAGLSMEGSLSGGVENPEGAYCGCLSAGLIFGMLAAESIVTSPPISR